MSRTSARAGALARYRKHGFYQVEGWMSGLDASMFAAVLGGQIAAGITGGLCEIGVHHGKSFFLLAAARGAGEGLLAIDLFEDDALYRDPEGLGRAAQFRRNAARRGVQLTEAETLKADTRSIGPEAIRDRIGALRFFSVDGGHSYDAALNDLRLAEACSGPHGVVAADDTMNIYWPDVSFALHDWLKQDRPDFAPFAASKGKTYLCRKEHRALYRAMLKPHLNAPVVVEMLGWEIDVYDVGVGSKILDRVRGS